MYAQTGLKCTSGRRQCRWHFCRTSRVSKSTNDVSGLQLVTRRNNVNIAMCMYVRAPGKCS